MKPTIQTKMAFNDNFNIGGNIKVVHPSKQKVANPQAMKNNPTREASISKYKILVFWYIKKELVSSMSREPNSLLKLAEKDININNIELFNEKAIIWINSLKDGF